jgi:hypothetical protein
MGCLGGSIPPHIELPLPFAVSVMTSLQKLLQYQEVAAAYVSSFRFFYRFFQYFLTL